LSGDDNLVNILFLTLLLMVARLLQINF